jgi:hypothetical protein
MESLLISEQLSNWSARIFGRWGEKVAKDYFLRFLADGGVGRSGVDFAPGDATNLFEAEIEP